MNRKGEKTKQEIREKAYQLFTKKGFKEVTMKDICELTGLSRGGLYRHYESTEQIFLEIVSAFSDKQRDQVLAEIERQIPAAVILEELLSKYADEMIDYESSFSLAICEFYSDPTISKEDNSIKKQYESSKSTWVKLINYGINTKEFNCVDPESVFHVILFAYQGVRMYSRLMKIDHNIPNQIISEIKRLLLPEGDRMENEIYLVRPTIELKEEALAYRNEHFQSGENIIYGSELFDKTESYEEWLNSVTLNSTPKTVNENWVVTDTFFAIRRSDNKIIGIIDLRHTLNEFLKDLGNCGYSVRPSERKKGYATEMLHQLLQAAKGADMKDLHISVEKTNAASIKVIQKNGGVYERSFSFENETADIYKIIL